MPNFDFNQVLAELGPDAAIRIANTPAWDGPGLFEQLLPELPRNNYNVETGSITIRPTMAGLAAMDSPYPPVGQIDVATFLEKTAKIASSAVLSEQAQRSMQAEFARLLLDGGDTAAAMRQEVLNFTDFVTVQPHRDTMEWLRGQALQKGALSWTFNKKALSVSYGVPSANLFAERTAGNHYGGATSQFWADVIAARSILRRFRMVIAHPNTIDLILGNRDVNQVDVVAQTDASTTLQRYRGDLERAETDPRYRVTITEYDREAEVIDPADPDTTQIVQMVEDGYVIFIGEGRGRGYRVGMGVTQDPDLDLSLGYTHIAPTVEGMGRPGRWARVYTPQSRPWQLAGEAVTNGLPVLENVDRVVVARTAMSG